MGTKQRMARQAASDRIRAALWGIVNPGQECRNQLNLCTSETQLITCYADPRSGTAC